MAPKQQVPDKYTPILAEESRSVRGWKYRVRGDGLVTVGTLGHGPYKRWTFKLSEYPDDGSDPEACILAEIDDRNKPPPGRNLRTPRYGNEWEGTIARQPNAVRLHMTDHVAFSCR